MTPSADRSLGETLNDLNVTLMKSFPHSYSDRQRHRDYAELFLNSPTGRRVFWDLLQRSGYYETPLRQNEDGDRAVYVRIGEANMARKIVHSVLVEPEKDPPTEAQTEQETTDGR